MFDEAIIIINGMDERKDKAGRLRLLISINKGVFAGDRKEK